MQPKRITMRAIAAFSLVAGMFGGSASAQNVADILARTPTQPGVTVTTPTGAEVATCKAEQLSWPKQGNVTPTGYVVRDSQGRLVRQFIDTTGRNNPNIFSYYTNGVEAYRELDANGDGKPDQFRWLGPNGGKWGADSNADGRIDTWYVISPEEVSQELFLAMVTKDTHRIEALLPTEEELKSLGLPAPEIAKIRQRASGAVKRAMDTAAALAQKGLTTQGKWIHLEAGVPHTTAGDTIGSAHDIIVHKNATVLFDRGDGKSADVFQTGEMMMIGRVWRLVDGPAPGAAPIGNPGEEGGTPLPDNPEFQKLVAALQKITLPADQTGMVKYHTDRAAILEQIVTLLPAAQQEAWQKQVIDAYTAASDGGDAASFTRLKQWRDTLAASGSKTGVAAYAAFRVVAAEYSEKLRSAKAEEVMKVQEWWREQLSQFVKAYPQAEESAEAMLRLAVAHEFAGKDGEAQAKQWYETLASTFPNHAYAAKAHGAVKRLTCNGQPFELTGTILGSGGQFSTSQIAGKPTIVYYWASWGRDVSGELKQLAELAKTHAAKGLQIVTVNLDDEPGAAVAAINAAQVPGTHLYMPGGLDRSPLAVAYGIQMVPHVFLVDREGKVINRNAQTGPVLRDEVEKLVK